MNTDESPKRTLGLGFLLLAVVQVAAVLVGACRRDPNAPVTWGELMVVLLIQAAIFGALAIRLLWFNYSYFG